MLNDISKDIQNKMKTSNLYSYEISEDKYGNETYEYSTSSDVIITVLWSPVSSEVEIAEYGSRVNEMLQACIFDSSITINEKDRIDIDDVLYDVISIKSYPTYRLIIVERVR